jgi:type II secretory pathway pseudopilin PulG
MTGPQWLHVDRLTEQRGTSMVDLLVAMLLFALVGSAALAGYTSISGTNRRIDDRTIALVEARQAVELMIRDLRAADPIDPLSSGQPVSTYDGSIAFKVYCATPGVNGCTANRLRQLRYTFQDNGMQRVAGSSVTFIGPSGPTGLPRSQQRSAVVNGATQPVFTYYDARGAKLDTTGVGLAVSSFNLCARRVQVHLVVQAEAGNPSSRVHLRTTVDLRNHHEVTQCTAP